MYIGYTRLSVCACVCVCLSLTTFPHYCTDPDVTWRNGRGCPLVVNCWADLQSVHGFPCYDNITRTRNVSECLYSFCLVCNSWSRFFYRPVALPIAQLTMSMKALKRTQSSDANQWTSFLIGSSELLASGRRDAARCHIKKSFAEMAPAPGGI